MLAEHALVCPSCGHLREECSDPSIDWHTHTAVCWATASREWGVRRLQEKHKDADPSPSELHPLDGVSVYVATEPPEVDEFI